MQGIYKITYIKTGKCYVGSSVDIEQRWKNHVCDLKRKTHHAQGLQNVFNKYGLDVLKFEVIEEVTDKDNLIEKEQYWINTLNSYYKGFNSIKYVGCRPKFSKKYRKNISIGTKKAMLDPIIREKCRQSKIHGKSYTVKLTEQQVEEIKLQLQKPINRRTLAKKYNVSVDAIDDILSGLNWGYIRPDLVMYKNNIHKLTETDIIEIKKLLKENKLKQPEIAKKFGIVQQTVSSIKLGKLWPKIKI